MQKVNAINNDSCPTLEQRYKVLRAALDTFSNPSFIMDREGTILEANKAFATRFSKATHEIINTNAFVLISLVEGELRKDNAEEALCSGNVVVLENKRDGRFSRISLSPIADEEGEATHLFITVEDITETKMVEKKAIHQKLFSTAVIESIPGGFFMIDPEGRFVMWNTYERDVIIGKPESEMPGTVAIEFIHPDDRPLITEKIENILKHGAEETEATRVLLHGGPDFIWHQLSGKRIIIDDLPFLIGTSIDITARKVAEVGALISSREQFRELFEWHSSVMLVVDTENNITDANHAAAAFYGWSVEELRRMNVSQITMNSSEMVIAEREQIMSLKHNRFSALHRRADGSTRDVEILVLHKTADIKDIFYCIISDVTERRLHENALKQSEERFRKLFESHSAAMIILDPDTATILDANYAAAVFYGWSIEELRTMSIHQITTASPDEVKSTLEKIKGSKQNEFLFRHKREDGSVRDVEVFSTPIEIDGKSILYEIIHDITERIQAAEESDRLKTAFLANISHEIRTPMNGIIGFSELLKDPHLSGEEQNEYIGLIQQSGQRMLNLINDLMDISKIDAKEVKLIESETSINQLLGDLLAFFKQESHKKGLQLTLTKALPDEQSIINTDSLKLNQVLTNLIQNAMKFTAKGGIDFGYTLKGSMLEFYVIDSGRGIPADKKERIFERFQQVDNSLTRNHEGSGLGLSISKALVELLGGTIKVASVEGSGSTFSFTLPYHPVLSLDSSAL